MFLVLFNTSSAFSENKINDHYLQKVCRIVQNKSGKCMVKCFEIYQAWNFHFLNARKHFDAFNVSLISLRFDSKIMAMICLRMVH